MREEIEENGVDAAEAQRRVSQQTVFTTHTPVEAGHDRFDPGLVRDTLEPLRNKLGFSEADFLAQGQRKPADDEAFCMTTLALRLSLWSNAVSALHGRTARSMWNVLWPHRAETDVPIGYITNGVHVSSWLAPPLVGFFTECLGADWEQNQCAPATWAAIGDVDDEQFWEVHQILKARLLESLQYWIRRQERRRDGDGSRVEALEQRFRPDVMTVAFARRFAAYKRADLIFADEERLAGLLGNRERPVQLIFAGKAHPRDEAGQTLIRRIFHLARSGAFKGKLLFLEDYDINTARHLVQGCDVWLNNPLRAREACGTSGMKALFNGVLNLSIQDGWWAEAYNGANGFSIGTGEAHADPERQRERDAESLYRVLEDEVIPMYYDRDDQGVPHGWVRRMKTALATLAWRFNSDRMMMEYARQCYLPAAGIKAHVPVQRRNPCAGGE
jgi:starch phosphorylase